MDYGDKRALFIKTLFRWHKNNYRDMPWRRTRDPYRILVSEVMLQQTGVERVREKYPQFIKKFPTAEKLATASLGDVLSVWSGMGYNRRAKYLHQCAQHIIKDHKGKFPREIRVLMTLPCIGLSSAAAVCAFAFDQDVPMIDTNVRRILARVFFKKRIPPDKELFLFARSLIPKGKGRLWNYAMLDLGATLCTARNHSSQCPLSDLHGKVGDFQYKKPQTAFKNSRRYYRGRIVRFLTERKHSTVYRVACFLKKTDKETEELLRQLSREHLIILRGRSIFLP